MPNDGGNLLLSEQEKETLIRDYSETACLIKRFMGSLEFIRGEIRNCLWIEDENATFAYTIQPIKQRIDRCA